MIPEKTFVFDDERMGFTAITRAPTYEKRFNEDGSFKQWDKVWRERDTLWRPCWMLNRYGTIGTLQEYDEKSFYQNNNDVTKAIYKVKGYHYRIAVWFCNKTGKRIA
jgi:hypothetical protein